MPDNSLQHIRHALHRLAEVSGDERQTAEFIINQLKELQPEVLYTNLGGHGVVAGFGPGGTDAPSVAIRCELDALPIAEDNSFDYLSNDPKTGHKCGHDGHMAIVLGVARQLAVHRPKTGRVYVLFQPAEETGAGATAMMADDDFSLINPDFLYALHNIPGQEKGTIIIKDDVFAAASVGMEINFKGKTAHAAHPEEGISPALAVGHTMSALSAIPQFHVPLNEQAKVTIVHCSMGDGQNTYGISPGAAQLGATLRTFDDILLQKVKEKACTLTQKCAEMYNLEAEIHWHEPFKATVNTDECAQRIRDVANSEGLKILEKDTPFSWSEDVGAFIANARGALFGLGAGTTQSPLHAADYDFPDDIIAPGVAMFMGLIEKHISLNQ